MIYYKEVCGTFTKLRSVTSEDAEFILSLRTNSELSRFLNKTENDLPLQQEWIRNQQTRAGDYYFVICKDNNQPVGLVGLYNINDDCSAGEMGRFICAATPVQYWEAIILLHDFGLDVLGLSKILYRELSENVKVRATTRRFGSEFVGYGHAVDEGTEYAEYQVSRSNYSEIREKSMKRLLEFSNKCTARNRGGSHGN